MRLGGHALVEQLSRYGVDLAFCVPGESYLPVHPDRTAVAFAGDGCFLMPA